MRSQVIFYIKNKLTNKERNTYMKLNTSRIRAYARTINAGMRGIEEVQEEYKLPVYIELLATYDWTLDMIDKTYLEQVKTELGIVEA